MKKRFFLPLILFLLCTLFTVGCSSEQGNDQNATFFPDNEKFLVGIQTVGLETKGSFYFSEDGAMHFLHEDPASPLFAMEEVFTKEGVHSYFHDMEYENHPFSGGIEVIYQTLDMIRQEEPEKIVREKETVKHCYEQKGLSFELKMESASGDPLEICGKSDGADFKINFASGA